MPMPEKSLYVLSKVFKTPPDVRFCKFINRFPEMSKVITLLDVVAEN